MARPGKKKRVLFVLEIIVLMLFIGGLYVYGQISTRLDKIVQPELKREQILVNSEAPKMTGYKTYAIFGVDSRGEAGEYGASNSDTMMVVSINNDTKDVRMVSLYRDTLLDVGNGTYMKANAAYSLGGPEQAISMLNTNLDLNITDYATADFTALVEIVDAVGGLDIPLSYAEIEHMNNYSIETAEVSGKTFTPVEKPEPAPADQEAIIGTYHLNGVQATSYCRIRYTSSMDMGRTERQRLVISMIVDKAKSASLSTLFKIVDSVFPMIETSISKDEILRLIPIMLGYDIGEKAGFPMNFKFANSPTKGSCIVPTTLESNVIELHKLLYGTTENYTPSPEIVERSNTILSAVGGEGQLDEAAVTPAAGQEGTDESAVWSGSDTDSSYDDGSYDDGSYDDGSYDDGSYDDGSYDDGSYDDGSYDDGSYDDGSYDDGSYDDGSYDDGSYDDGSYDDGSYDDGSYDDGSYE